ncbi:hypothetical protein AX14_003896 [Amanita brunnescens Koide BX004]|nr:hypothetical protein AX14_003896 [Amanita brunnescens Koide BX004]
MEFSLNSPTGSNPALYPGYAGAQESFKTALPEGLEAAKEQEVLMMALPEKDKYQHTPAGQTGASSSYYPAQLRAPVPFSTNRQVKTSTIRSQYIPPFHSFSNNTDKIDKLSNEIKEMGSNMTNTINTLIEEICQDRRSRQSSSWSLRGRSPSSRWSVLTQSQLSEIREDVEHGNRASAQEDAGQTDDAHIAEQNPAKDLICQLAEAGALDVLVGLQRMELMCTQNRATYS